MKSSSASLVYISRATKVAADRSAVVPRMECDMSAVGFRLIHYRDAMLPASLQRCRGLSSASPVHAGRVKDNPQSVQTVSFSDTLVPKPAVQPLIVILCTADTEFVLPCLDPGFADTIDSPDHIVT